ncbi:MAG: excinuclease ABC subunit A, partial [Flavobacteriaceae bacterium]|nr:excinuclease ABC subunit A [Flavobacteriaceae bacterium]
MATITEANPKDNIVIKGAKLHNLKDIDVVIPRNQLVVITGLSGSGKSSLAFDTLYAEGQRRYVESLSSYARQFLGKLDKPKVDSIKGIAPAIAIEQKVNSTNPRSTVGTSTEIYDYLKLLFARIGRTYSPVSGKEVKKHTVTDVVSFVKGFEENTKLLLLAPITIPENRDKKKTLQLLSLQGYARIKYGGEVHRIDEDLHETVGDQLYLVVDRIIKKEDEDFFNRLANAVDSAFFEGKGNCIIEDLSSGKQTSFSNAFELDDITFLEPNVHLFSFNNPYGACPKCEGYGDIIGIDEDLVIPKTSLSVYENAIFPWRGESMGWYRDQLVNSAYKFDFPIHKPWFELTEEQKELVWEGNSHFIGINKFFKQLEDKSYKIQNRVMLSRYRGKTRCPECKGKRLRKETSYVRINGHSISDLV